MNKNTKTLSVVVLIFFCFCLLMTFIGSIIMCIDDIEAGIMPLLAFIMLLISTILIGTSRKGKNNYIASLVLGYIAMLFQYVSYIFVYWELSYIGWILCCLSASIVFWINILLIIVIVLNKTGGREGEKKEVNVAEPKPKAISDEEYYKSMKAIKGLLDDGVISQEEFEEEKRKLYLKKYPEKRDDRVTSTIKKLMELKAEGILTEEEFEEEKKKVLCEKSSEVTKNAETIEEETVIPNKEEKKRTFL